MIGPEMEFLGTVASWGRHLKQTIELAANGCDETGSPKGFPETREPQATVETREPQAAVETKERSDHLSPARAA